MIQLTKQLIDIIDKHAQEAYPNECCGAVLGHLHLAPAHGAESGQRTAVDLLPIENQFEDAEQYHRFKITPKDFLRCERRARELNCELIGFYHSHPDHPAKPSQYDLDHALPVYSYIIVNTHLANGACAAGDRTSWILRNDVREFEEEKIVVAL